MPAIAYDGERLFLPPAGPAARHASRKAGSGLQQGLDLAADDLRLIHPGQPLLGAVV
jgi:hypothetical protein